MSHFLLSARVPRPRDAAPIRVARPAAWTGRPDLGESEVAVLLTDCRDVAAAVRACRTLMPRAQIWLYGADLPPDERDAAEAAGALVRSVAPSSRDLLVRRMLAEVDADIYILAHGASADDVCVAPLAVAEVDAGRDLVDVSRFAVALPTDAADRALGRAVDFAFGGGSDLLRSDFKACSRRFALSYRRTAPRGGAEAASARELALHALRLRLPVGRVSALGAGRPDPRPAPSRCFAGWASTLATIVRLLVEERPRRLFGLVGLPLAALGIATVAPELKVHRWHAVLSPGAQSMVALALLATGAALGSAGVLLDTLASARQEVVRLGVAAIPRRAERPGGGPQSSVS